MKASEAYYDEIAINFSPVWPEDHEWVNIHDGKEVKKKVVENLVDKYIDTTEANIVVHSESCIGVKLSTVDIVNFISDHIFHGEIQVANLQFTSFIAILKNGVATGWQTLTDNE